MNNGFSLYLGLDNSLLENLELLERAHSYGLQRIFTSLHIPETNVEKLQAELQELTKIAKSYGMDFISDVSPQTLDMLGLSQLDLRALSQWGITTLRLDYGYGPDEIAEISKSGFKVQLNASTCDQVLLESLIKAGAQIKAVEALYNFYPRVGTGLSAEVLYQQNKLLHNYGIVTAAFVPGYNRPRSPLYQGLPTLEMHRYQSVDFARRHLVALNTDNIFIGDSLPTNGELACLARKLPAPIVLQAKSYTNDLALMAKLAGQLFTVRADSATGAVRTEESRHLLAGLVIEPEYRGERRAGMLTIDNIWSGRYQGELQVITTAQQACETVNIVGEILSSDQVMLPLLHPHSQFMIEWTD